MLTWMCCLAWMCGLVCGVRNGETAARQLVCRAAYPWPSFTSRCGPPAARTSSIVLPPPALCVAQLFEEQRALLDGLAHQLHIAPYGITSKGPPFSGERWSWRLPGDQLTQPERVIPWSPPAAAAAAVPASQEAQQQQQQQQVAAAAPPDPRRQPEVAAELAAARTWFGGGRDEQPPAFALPPAADGTPLSWSQEPHFKEGQPEVSSAAAAAAAAAAAEERAPGDGGECWRGGVVSGRTSSSRACNAWSHCAAWLLTVPLTQCLVCLNCPSAHR